MENVSSERIARRLARWLAERDGAHSDGDFKLNPKYEAYLEEAEELVNLLPSFGFYPVKK